jgi:adenosylhomocysteine nucleosidase
VVSAKRVRVGIAIGITNAGQECPTGNEKPGNLSTHRRIAIVAALKREIAPLVKDWPVTRFSHEGREFNFYESSYAVAVCGGIGAEYARRASEAAVTKYSPQVLISVGVAGAAVPELHVGDTVFPTMVVDAGDGSRHVTLIRSAPIHSSSLARIVLVSYPKVAGAEQKRQLAKSYGAHAVEMEAAGVARAAQVHGLQFLVVKAISDEVDFDLPELNRFVYGGQFDTKSLILYLIPRPWLWLTMVRLARNTQLASDNLCAWLRESALTNTIVSDVKSGGQEYPHKTSFPPHT